MIAQIRTGDDAAKLPLIKLWGHSGEDFRLYLLTLEMSMYRRDDFSRATAENLRSIIVEAADAIGEVAQRKDQIGFEAAKALAFAGGDDGSTPEDMEIQTRCGTGIWERFDYNCARVLKSVTKQSPTHVLVLLTSQDPRVFGGALDALFTANEELAVRKAAERIEDPNEQIRVHCAKVIARGPVPSDQFALLDKMFKTASPNMLVWIGMCLDLEAAVARYPKVAWRDLPRGLRYSLVTEYFSEAFKDRCPLSLSQVAMTDPDPEVASLAAEIGGGSEVTRFNPLWMKSKRLASRLARRLMEEAAKQDPERWISLIRQGGPYVSDSTLLHIPSSSPRAVEMYLAALPQVDRLSYINLPFSIAEDLSKFGIVLEKTLRSANPTLRREGALAIGRSEEAIKRFGGLVLMDKDPSVLETVLSWPKVVGEKYRQEVVLRLLASKDREAVLSAMLQIAQSSDVEGLDYLRPTAKSTDPQFAELASTALACANKGS